MPRARQDFSGRVFGLLTVRRDYGDLRFSSQHVERLLLCDCNCGNEHIVRLKNLTAGTTRSCGCFARKVRAMRRAEKKGKKVEVTCE
jgi:hypothetical protein